MKIFDQINLVPHVYTNPKSVEIAGKQVTRWESRFGNGDTSYSINVGLAYNEQYSMFGKNCYGCNETLRLDQIYVDNKTYVS